LARNPNAFGFFKDKSDVLEHSELLSSNPNAISLLEKHPEKICWSALSENPNAMPLLKANPTKIIWPKLCLNTSPEAIEFLRQHPDKIDWNCLSMNPSAIPLFRENLVKYLDKLNWRALSANPNGLDIAFLLKFHDSEKNKIDWSLVSLHTNCVGYLETNKDKIDWCTLCDNPNLKAIQLIEKFLSDGNSDKDLCWSKLSENKNAIDLLKKYPSKIDYERLCCNPNGISLIEHVFGSICLLNKDTDDLITNLFANPSIFEEVEETQAPATSPLPKSKPLQLRPFVMNLIDKFTAAYHHVTEKIATDEVLKEFVGVKVLSIKPDFTALSENPNAIHFLEANQDKIDWEFLSLNPNAIHLLEANPEKIDWSYLSRNPNAIHLLEANTDKINWRNLSQNPNAVHLLEANPNRIDWRNLSQNPNAIHLLEANPDKIDWEQLSQNPNAIPLLKANRDKIHWWSLCFNRNAIFILEDELFSKRLDKKVDKNRVNTQTLSRNPAAIHLLQKNPDLIDWIHLSSNPMAIRLLEANQDKINWRHLSENPNAIHLLEANPDKIHWTNLSMNPNAMQLLEKYQHKLTLNDLQHMMFNPAIFITSSGNAKSV
jgi:hypothetical protein